MQNKRMDVEQQEDPAVIKADPYLHGLSLSHMFAFLCVCVCHGVAYCSDVYANEPS